MEVPVEKLATFPMEKMEPGVEVAMPTLPFLSTMKEVADDEPITNCGTPAVELIESFANGVEVPRPSRVLLSSQKNDEVDDA